MDLVPAPYRAPALGSSCLGGLLGTGVAFVLAWLDARLVAMAWERAEVGVGAPANGFVLLVELPFTALAYLVVLVLADDVAVRLGRGAWLWCLRLAFLGIIFAAGSAVFFRLNDAG